MKHIYLLSIVATLAVSAVALADPSDDRPRTSGAVGADGVCSTDITSAYSITTSGGASKPIAACTGSCPTWGHSPTLASEGPIEIDGMCYADGGLTMGADANLGVYNLLATPATGAQCTWDELGDTCATRTDDANAGNRTINAENVSPFAAAGKTAGNLILAPSLDSKTVTCAVATCTSSDTVVVTRTINGTVTGPTTLTFGTDFCSSTCANDNAMATSLATAIDALSGVGATSSSAVVGVTADRFTTNITITDSNTHAACTVLAAGTDGVVDIPISLTTATSTNQALCFQGSASSTCITGNTGTTLWFSNGATGLASIVAGAINAYGTSSTIGGSATAYIDGTGVHSSATNKIDWVGRGSLTSDAAGGILTAIGAVSLGELAGKLVGTQVITLNNASAQTIYTVPAGYYLVPTGFVIRNPSAGTDATVAGGWGGDANCTDYLAGIVFGAQLASTSAFVPEYKASNSGGLTYASATVICYRLTVASVDADTVTMTLFGYLRQNP